VIDDLFVPGRLCLFGEHSDWAGAYRRTHADVVPGHCIVAGTDQGLSARAGPSKLVEFASVGAPGDGLRMRATVATLDAVARGGGFFSYAAGVAAEIVDRYGTDGLRIDVTASDLPVGKGLSSSAAICVLVARAFNRVYRLDLDVRDEMEIAYAGERRAGSQCGRMDQVCAYGRTTTFLTFDGPRFEIEPIPVGGPMHLLVVDLRRAKDTRRILADLNACFPDAGGAVAQGVRDALGPANATIATEARRILAGGDVEALGCLMDDAQALFDRAVAPACPELRAPRLHEVLAHPAVRVLGWGGKGVGSQGDGSAQIVARGAAERDELAAILSRDLAVACFPLTLGV